MTIQELIARRDRMWHIAVRLKGCSVVGANLSLIMLVLGIFIDNRLPIYWAACLISLSSFIMIIVADKVFLRRADRLAIDAEELQRYFKS